MAVVINPIGHQLNSQTNLCEKREIIALNNEQHKAGVLLDCFL